MRFSFPVRAVLCVMPLRTVLFDPPSPQPSPRGRGSAKVRFVAALSILLVLAALPLRAEVAVPPLAARVTDLTGTLTPDQKAALERKLAAFEQEKGSQIAVLLVPTTEPETIEQYSIRVVDQWQLGRRGIDDGALVLLARQDRTVRIEVGRGLEGVVPDAVANRIVEDVMVPYFKQGDFYGGIGAGVDRLIGVVHGEPLPPPRGRGASRPEPEAGSGLMLALFGGLFGGQILRFIFGRFLGGLIAGVGTGILSLLFGLPFLFALFVGFFVLVAVLGGTGRAGPGGWYGGGPSGWGGSSGGGGFRGGGGGFSGGGASGRW
jgi:uncharacterized protein